MQTAKNPVPVVRNEYGNIRFTRDFLAQFDVPENGYVVVYDQRVRRAYFYQNTDLGYFRTLVRNKRRRPIVVRSDDVLVSVSKNDEISYGDTYGVFRIA